MKSVVIGFFALAVGVLVILAANSRAQAQIAFPTPPKRQYAPVEYNVVDASDKNVGTVQLQLQQLGRDGWQFVGSSPLKGGHGQVFILSRSPR